MQVQSLGGEDPQEEEMATHSSTLAWRIPWTEEPGGLQSTGSQRVRHNLTTKQQWQIYITANIYAPNIRGPKFTQTVTDLKGEIDNNQ